MTTLETIKNFDDGEYGIGCKAYDFTRDEALGIVALAEVKAHEENDDRNWWTLHILNQAVME